MFVVSIILLFILKIKYARKPVIHTLLRHYGVQGVTVFRRLEDFDFKLKKTSADLEFLLCCSLNKLTPKFLKFKISLSRFHGDSNYRNYQFQLLQKEIDSKRNRLQELRNLYQDSYFQLKEISSVLDFNHFILKIKERNDLRISKVQQVHNRKLFKLGLSEKYQTLPPSKVVFNLSSSTITPQQEEALSLGLKFCFHPLKINYSRYFASFEKLYKTLSSEKIQECMPNSLRHVQLNLKSIALRYYYSFRSKLSNHHKSLISSLKDLSSNKNLIITHPDKGNGVVILNKSDYIIKMNDILEDDTKFFKSNADLFSTLLKYEDKTNRLLETLFKQNIIDEETKFRLRSSGSKPGIMYGLPKIHKPDVPMRPILSTIDSHNYQVSKYLNNLLSPFIDSPFIVKDSFDFVNEITNFKNDGYIMASFDIKSLFTNIPIDETCNIILDKIFLDKKTKFQKFDRPTFQKLLHICLKDNFFLFNQNLYFQKDGTPMGGCISPTLANLFLGFHEINWLKNCPDSFKPSFYRRYVDDTFILFKNYDHIKKFLEYLNLQHKNIQFTCEIEKNQKLPFLDISISKTNNAFITDSYRKSTFTGLGMKFDSAIPDRYKSNLVNCLIDRAFKINSTLSGFNDQISKLKTYFFQNHFPVKFVNKILKSKLDSFDRPKLIQSTASKKILYSSIPFLSNVTNKQINFDIQNIIKKYFPHLDLRLIFRNNFTVGSFFPYKDVLPISVLSNVVYKYSCEHCSATYYGETTRHLKTRIAEHRGLSARTGKPITRPLFSSIRDHCISENHDLKTVNFSILSRSNRNDLKIIEAILIDRDKPDLNIMHSDNLSILS